MALRRLMTGVLPLASLPYPDTIRRRSAESSLPLLLPHRVSNCSNPKSSMLSLRRSHCIRITFFLWS